MKSKSLTLAVGAACLAGALVTAEAASTRTASGTWNGVNWSAQSMIVGVQSTATLAGGAIRATSPPAASTSGSPR